MPQTCLRITELAFIEGDKEGFTKHNVGDHMLMGVAIWSWYTRRIFTKVFTALLPVLPLCQVLPVQQHSVGSVGDVSCAVKGLCLIPEWIKGRRRLCSLTLKKRFEPTDSFWTSSEEHLHPSKSIKSQKKLFLSQCYVVISGRMHKLYRFGSH